MTHTDHIIRVWYTYYIIRKNKKYLRAFWKFCFKAGCTSRVRLAKPDNTLRPKMVKWNEILLISPLAATGVIRLHPSSALRFTNSQSTTWVCMYSFLLRVQKPPFFYYYLYTCLFQFITFS